MRRETTNVIRFVIEDLLPPIVRDSQFFRATARLVWGRHIDKLADFRKRAAFLSPEGYETLYRVHPRIHDQTDNSQACIGRIASNVVGSSILDVGCGTGYLLRAITACRKEQFHKIVGVDFVRPTELETDDIEFIQAPIECLPFPDKSFDTVICTHVLEHILDYRAAIRELRRVAAKRLIIVVPKEREGIYTFNPHFNFFPYKHSFLRAMINLPEKWECTLFGRDIYYTELV